MTMINEFFDDLTGEVSSVDPRDENFDSGTEEPINVENELQEIHAQLSDDYLSMESHFASLREINHLRKEITNRNAISREDRISLESAGVTGLPHQNKYTIDYSLSNLKASLEEADKTVISKLKKIKDFFVGLLTKFTNFFKGLVDKFVNFLFRKKKDSAQQEKKQQETQKKAVLLLEQVQGEPEEKQDSIHKIFREHLAYGLSPLQIKALSHGETVNDEVIEAVKSEVRKIRYGNVLNTLFYDITKEDGKNKQKWLDFTNAMVGELEKANAFRDLMDYHESLTPEDEVDSSKLEPIFVVGSAFEKVAYNSGGRPGNTNDVSVLNDAKNRINQLAGMRTKIDNIRDEVSKHRDVLKTMYSMLTVDYISSKVDVVHDYKFGNSPKGENSLEVLNMMDRERNTFSAMTSLAFLFASKMSLMYSDIEDCDRDIDFIDAMYDDFKKYSGTVSTENRLTDFIKNIFKRKNKNISMYEMSKKLIEGVLKSQHELDMYSSNEILRILKSMGIVNVTMETLPGYIKGDFLTKLRVPAGSELIAGDNENYGFVEKVILSLFDDVTGLMTDSEKPDFFTKINDSYIDGYIDKLKLYDANPSYFGSMPYSVMMEQGVILPADDVIEISLYRYGVDCLPIGDGLAENVEFAKKYRIPLEYNFSDYPAKLDTTISAIAKKNTKATVSIETAYKYMDLFNDKSKTATYSALTNFDINKFESRVKEHVKFLKTKLPELKELSAVAEKDKLLDQYHKALIMSLETDPETTMRVVRLFVSISDTLKQFHEVASDRVMSHTKVLQLYLHAPELQSLQLVNQTMFMGFATGLLSHDYENISMEAGFLDNMLNKFKGLFGMKSKPKDASIAAQYQRLINTVRNSPEPKASLQVLRVAKDLNKLIGTDLYGHNIHDYIRYRLGDEIQFPAVTDFVHEYSITGDFIDELIFYNMISNTNEATLNYENNLTSAISKTKKYIEMVKNGASFQDVEKAETLLYFDPNNGYVIMKDTLNAYHINMALEKSNDFAKKYGLVAKKDRVNDCDKKVFDVIDKLTDSNSKKGISINDYIEICDKFDDYADGVEMSNMLELDLNSFEQAIADAKKEFSGLIGELKSLKITDKELSVYNNKLIDILTNEPDFVLNIFMFNQYVARALFFVVVANRRFLVSLNDILEDYVKQLK